MEKISPAWTLTPSAAIALQKQLAPHVIRENMLDQVQWTYRQASDMF